MKDLKLPNDKSNKTRIRYLIIIFLIGSIYLGFLNFSQSAKHDSNVSNSTSNRQFTEVGTEQENLNNWIHINHDLFGSRYSNQNIITRDNVKDLQVKWILFNDIEIQEPPIVKNGIGYVQDRVGNVISFNTDTGKVNWKFKGGYGPTMGLSLDKKMIFSSSSTNSTIVAINSSDGNRIWVSKHLGNSTLGYSIDSAPIVWHDYVIAGSGGSGLPPGLGYVKGNITALNKTNGNIIWNLDTTTGDWVKKGKTPPNGGATAWSGGSLDPETGLLYIPLGSASPNFNATTRQSPNFYSNNMVCINISNGKIVWATPFIAYGTILPVGLPDTHDWDASWGSSISKIQLSNGTKIKIVIGHDKKGNVMAMNAATGKEIWWTILGKEINTESLPSPNGSGMIWSYGVFNYHAVDENTVYISATNRGLNYFTDGISGHKISPPDTIEQGLKNGSITALDITTGKIKWQRTFAYPTRISPLVTDSILFAGFIPFDGKTRTGVIIALDKNSGEEIWKKNINASVGAVGPSIADGKLFIPTSKITASNGTKLGGSIIALGLS